MVFGVNWTYPQFFCYGGGGVIDWSDGMIGGCLACVSAGEVSLDFSEPGAAEWYFENYVLRGNPLFSDEEARRAGKMPNGMTAPDGFWNMSVKERADFTKLASWMNFTNPSITQEELLGAGGKSAAGGKNGPPPSYYSSFKQLLKYSKFIENSAAQWHVDKNTLTAVLIYEMMDPEAKFSELTGGFEAPALYAKRGATGSYGIAQLEVYKARMVLQKYKGKVFSEGLRGNVQIVALPIKPKYATDIAAMYLKYLKDSIKVKATRDEGGYYTRDISWAEAAVTYCGCAGVTMSASTGTFGWSRFST